MGTQPHLIVEQALDAGHRRRLADEVREGEIDHAAACVEPGEHPVEQRAEAGDVECVVMRLEDLDEARHVRALRVVRQADEHVGLHDGVDDGAAGRRTFSGWTRPRMPTSSMATARVSKMDWMSGSGRRSGAFMHGCRS
jgi:hypothetical protein